ncbi:hypothetical protein [Marinivivus vitaminiproducens]|uniref:hypothetical protein n=1 Tax=Marinivivus vitaminiproducens TaxID=3035935 RepID=UPI0027A175FC|nr:hypothetical protein P4R82_11080 [Geminicoccaceae bacterium SCSIO 64248]
MTWGVIVGLGVVCLLAAGALLLVLLHFRRPLLWLELERRLAGSSLAASSGIRRLACGRRSIEAWLAVYRPALIDAVALPEPDPVIEGALHVRVGGKPSRADLHGTLTEHLADRTPLLLVGETATGISALAAALARDACRPDIPETGAVLPLWLTGPVGREQLADPAWLVREVGREIRRHLKFAVPVSDTLVASLLRRGRLLVIIDGVRGGAVEESHKLIRSRERRPLRRLLVATGPVESGLKEAPVLVQTLPLAERQLPDALAGMLSASGRPVRFGRNEMPKLARLARRAVPDPAGVPSGIAAAYAELAALARQQRRRATLPGPRSETDLLIQSAQHLFRDVTFTAGELTRDAAALAHACLDEGLMPVRMPVHTALAAMRGGDVRDRLRLLDRLGLIRMIHTGPGDLAVRFRDDATATAFAALHLATIARAKGEAWNTLRPRLLAVDTDDAAALRRALGHLGIAYERRTVRATPEAARAAEDELAVSAA